MGELKKMSECPFKWEKTIHWGDECEFTNTFFACDMRVRGGENLSCVGEDKCPIITNRKPYEPKEYKEYRDYLKNGGKKIYTSWIRGKR